MFYFTFFLSHKTNPDGSWHCDYAFLPALVIHYHSADRIIQLMFNFMIFNFFVILKLRPKI